MDDEQLAVLTEEERKSLDRHPSGKITLLRHECCYDAEPALRSLAASRALVGEKDKALGAADEPHLEGWEGERVCRSDYDDEGKMVTVDPECPGCLADVQVDAALALTEADMLKRLEEK